MRGLPGSGKSTFCEVLSENGKYPVFSIDEYFTKDGNYQFVFDQNHLAYKACEEKVLKALSANTPKVFVDHTFTLEWEMVPYFKMAREKGYRVFVLTMENRHGGENIHGVSEEQLKKMGEKFKVGLYPGQDL